jgi:cation transport ATPase
MTCAACAARVEKKLCGLEDVSAAVNFATGTAIVTAASSVPVGVGGAGRARRDCHARDELRNRCQRPGGRRGVQGRAGAPGADRAADLRGARAAGTWAVAVMGGSAATHDNFWQLFARPAGSQRWKLVTPPGTPGNGGLVLAGAGRSLIAGTGSTWHAAGPALPAALTAQPVQVLRLTSTQSSTVALLAAGASHVASMAEDGRITRRG